MTTDDRVSIVEELRRAKEGKNIVRFISTHPDDDHIRGLDYLDDQLILLNFYCVENNATKLYATDAFNRYCELRGSEKAFHIFAGCTRRWMNQGDDERGAAGIEILWPVITNAHYIDALRNAAAGASPNNISTIVKYCQQNGASVLWLGDLETEFMEAIYAAIDLPSIDIVFAPHHGRESGRIPSSWLVDLDPKIIVLGEAPTEHLNYYSGYNTLSQNSAGDIRFHCDGSKVHIFVSSPSYSVSFLQNRYKESANDYYLGTLEL